ncbi:uncharacterized protein LOC109830585 [Asparagus officinalis]|uniref:uncharacterized protein LOC109830585 n=1 Tax=Asparagus officinalis TaxID=4686 RepID=UPI00098E3CCE|nr:uncharacterized protein LOC109830585 [Asparagus officinalis]
MKNLYPKSKGKIHPSPALPSAATSAAASGGRPLRSQNSYRSNLHLDGGAFVEDKEVVAYLMIRSINGPPDFTRPRFDCGCFDCYTFFWWRWDCSKDREVIHMAIEGFEEHLASKETKKKRKKSKDERKRKEEREWENEKAVEVFEVAEENKGFDEDAVTLSEEKEDEIETNEEAVEISGCLTRVYGAFGVREPEFF